VANWKTKALAALRKHVDEESVQFTEKAKNELAALDLYADDALEVLGSMTTNELTERVRSTSTGEWLYVFKPHLDEMRLYVKLALRAFCDVISFHPDTGEDADDQG